MTNPTQPTRLQALASLIDDLRRLELKLDSDTRLEAARSDDGGQIDTALVSRTRLTSQGHLVASLAYTRRFRLWQQRPVPEPAATEPPLAAPGLGLGLGLGQG